MNKLRKKQKKLYRIMKFSVIFTAVFIFIYIGVQPYVSSFNNTAAVILNYFCDLLIIAVLILLFMYYSKYGKCDSFLTAAENEINDAGYYITSRKIESVNDYCNTISDDLMSCGFSLNRNIEINELDFNTKALKGKEYFYIVDVENTDRNDILAYLDAVIFDITARMVKRSGSAVLCFVCENADETAVALSKMVTPVGKKEQLKIAVAIAEVSTQRVYFLGNVDTKCKRLIANFVMNCEIPIKEQYIADERLPFQFELEEKMKKFNLKDFKNGKFYIH